MNFNQEKGNQIKFQIKMILEMLQIQFQTSI